MNEYELDFNFFKHKEKTEFFINKDFIFFCNRGYSFNNYTVKDLGKLSNLLAYNLKKKTINKIDIMSILFYLL